jgi:hypothetical protein
LVKKGQKKMTDISLYQGLPQVNWDHMLNKAEDLLSEEEIGTHIVGIYPCGKRIYGLDSEGMDILCLYVDLPEKILDPLYNTHKVSKLSYRGSKYNQDKIWFYDFHFWIQDFISSYLNPSESQSIDIFIPVLHDILYESESISKIISLCNDLIKKIGMINISGARKDIFYMRTLLLWNSIEVFIPNLNKDWGEVLNITTSEEALKSLDLRIRKMALENTRLDPIDQKLYHCLLQQELGKVSREKDMNYYIPILEKEYFDNLRKETVRFYKQLL